MSGLPKTIMLVVLGLALGSGTTVYLMMKTSDKFIKKALEAKAAAAAAKIPDKPWDFWTVEMENLANDLKEERAKLKQQEEAIRQERARLLVDQQELEKTRNQIEALRASIDQRLIEVTSDEMGNLKSLAQLYSNMTPKSAVAVFKHTDDVTVVKTLSVMKKEIAATIMEEMVRQSAADVEFAKRAAAITEKLRLLKTAKAQGSP